MKFLCLFSCWPRSLHNVTFKSPDLKPRLMIRWMGPRSLGSQRNVSDNLRSSPLDGSSANHRPCSSALNFVVYPDSCESENTDSPNSGLTALANYVVSFSTGACPGSAVECLVTF